MITPADIENAAFGTTRLKEGYDQDEVDAFLDRVTADYTAVLLDRDRYQEDATILRRKLEQAASEPVTTVLPLPPTASAERILVAAQRTADQVEAEVNAEAGRLRAAARVEADGIKKAAETERQEILNRLEVERAALEENIQMLRAKRSNYKSWLRASLARMEEEEVNGD